MKAELFVIVFCMVGVGAFVTYERHKAGNGNESNIKIRNGDYNEEINYSGKIIFSDDENSIKSISPSGFLHFTENDKIMKVEADKQGNLSYGFWYGDNKQAMDSTAHQFLVHMIKEMIAWGIDAKKRMELVYSRGGDTALLNEMWNIKNGEVRKMYLDKLLQSDTVSATLISALKKTMASSTIDDDGKWQLLQKLTLAQLKDSLMSTMYMQTVESFREDYLKANAINNILSKAPSPNIINQSFHIIKSMPDENEKSDLLNMMINKINLADQQYDSLLDVLGKYNDDGQKENILLKLISKQNLPLSQFDNILNVVPKIRDDNQKQNLYKNLSMMKNLSEGQWSSLIGQAININSEDSKTDLLVYMSINMPKDDSTKAIYKRVAKTITDNAAYGKVMRAIE